MEIEETDLNLWYDLLACLKKVCFKDGKFPKPRLKCLGIKQPEDRQRLLFHRLLLQKTWKSLHQKKFLCQKIPLFYCYVWKHHCCAPMTACNIYVHPSNIYPKHGIGPLFRFLYSLENFESIPIHHSDFNSYPYIFTCLVDTHSYLPTFLTWLESTRSVVKLNFNRNGMNEARTTMAYCFFLLLFSRLLQYRQDHQTILGCLLVRWGHLLQLSQLNKMWSSTF